MSDTAESRSAQVSASDHAPPSEVKDQTNARVQRLRTLTIHRAEPGSDAIPPKHTSKKIAIFGVLTFGVGVMLGLTSALLLQRYTGLTNLPAVVGTRTVGETLTAIPAQTGAASPKPASWVVAGYLVARRQAIIGVEVTARVSEVLVSEGDTVEQGQVLARLANATAQSELAIARSRADAMAANIDVIAAQVAEAGHILERRRILLARHVVSVAELQNAEAQYRALGARLREAQVQADTARLEVERAQLILAQHTVTAPFAGVVDSCMAQPGEILSPVSMIGSSAQIGVCSIVDTATIGIEIDVTEANIQRLAIGAQAVAIVDALPDRRFAARVSAILPTANRERSTVRVRLSIENPSDDLRPEMVVKVTFNPSALPRDATETGG